MTGKVLFCSECKSSFRTKGDIGDKQVRCPNCGGMLAEASDPSETAAVEAGRAGKERDPWIGKVLGGCKLEKKLGHGGMAAVYRAKHLRLDIPVAVKIMDPGPTGRDPSFVQRFVREARSAAKLRHPNVVSVLDVGRQGETYFIIMELVEGGSVRDLIEKQGRVEPARALAIVIDIAKALKIAYDQKLIHRDIKPDNIMLDVDGTPKLADLGLAKAEDDTRDFSLTRSGVVVGTPYYISPEQIEDSRSADIRSDVYSLGATFYHIVCGSVPFEGNSAITVLRKHIDENPVSPSKMCPDVPEPISKVILRMLQKDPRERPQTPEELIEDLKAAGAKLGLFDTISVGGTSLFVPSQPVKTMKRSFAWTFVGLALVLAMILGLWTLAQRAKRPNRGKAAVAGTKQAKGTEPRPVAGAPVSNAEFRIWVMPNYTGGAMQNWRDLERIGANQFLYSKARMGNWALASMLAMVLADTPRIKVLVTSGCVPAPAMDTQAVGLRITKAFAPDAVARVQFTKNATGVVAQVFWTQAAKTDLLTEVQMPDPPGQGIYGAADKGAEAILKKIRAQRKWGAAVTPRPARDVVPTRQDRLETFCRLLYAESLADWQSLIEAWDEARKSGRADPASDVLACMAFLATGEGKRASEVAAQFPKVPSGKEPPEVADLRPFVLAFVKENGPAAKLLAEDYITKYRWSPRGQFLLGLVREVLLHRPDDAMASYRGGLSADPFYLPSLEGLVRVLWQEKQPGEIHKVMQAYRMELKEVAPEFAARAVMIVGRQTRVDGEQPLMRLRRWRRDSGERPFAPRRNP